MQGSRRLCASHLRCAVIEAYLVANLSTQSALHLMGYPLGHCDGSHTAGLGDADFAIFTNTYTKKKQGGEVGMRNQWSHLYPNLKPHITRGRAAE